MFIFFSQEGKLLTKAYNLREDDEKIKDYIKSFLAIKYERRKHWTEKDIVWKKRNEYLEGAAQYIQHKIMSINTNMQFNFKHKFNTLAPLEQEIILAIDFMLVNNISSLSEDANSESKMLNLCYYSGATQGLLLDKIMPNWKDTFFEEGVYFESLLSNAVNFDDSDQSVYFNKAIKKYVKN